MPPKSCFFHRLAQVYLPNIFLYTFYSFFPILLYLFQHYRVHHHNIVVKQNFQLLWQLYYAIFTMITCPKNLPSIWAQLSFLIRAQLGDSLIGHNIAQPFAHWPWHYQRLYTQTINKVFKDIFVSIRNCQDLGYLFRPPKRLFDHSFLGDFLNIILILRKYFGSSISKLNISFYLQQYINN